jgi:hypothetical protein
LVGDAEFTFDSLKEERRASGRRSLHDPNAYAHGETDEQPHRTQEKSKRGEDSFADPHRMLLVRVSALRGKTAR